MNRILIRHASCAFGSTAFERLLTELPEMSVTRIRTCTANENSRPAISEIENP
jgi:hypothetical protein